MGGDPEKNNKEKGIHAGIALQKGRVFHSIAECFIVWETEKENAHKPLDTQKKI